MISCCFTLPVQKIDNRQQHEKEKDYKEVKAEVTVTGSGCCQSKLCLPRVTHFDEGFAMRCLLKIKQERQGWHCSRAELTPWEDSSPDTELRSCCSGEKRAAEPLTHVMTFPTCYMVWQTHLCSPLCLATKF